MNSLTTTYLNWEYLSGVSQNIWFQEYLLYVAVAVLLFPVLLKIYFKLRNRGEAYKSFDRKWFWGFITLGLLGLFAWFSVGQGLPTLGSRLTVFAWLLAIAVYKIYLFIYYRRVTVGDVLKFHTKKRKERYLK